MDAAFPGEGSSSSDGVMLAAENPKKKAGRKKFRETRHPVYRGIRQRNSGRWVCELRYPNNWKTRLWLGTFQTAEMAARAHDVAAIAIRGPSACLNFADSAWRLPVPASTDPKDIQRAAVEAAEAFRPSRAPQPTAGNDQLPAEGPASAGVPADVPLQSYSFDDVFLMEDHNMWNPEVVSDMYKGMMLPLPPELNDHELVYDDDGSDFDLPLWSFSI